MLRSAILSLALSFAWASPYAARAQGIAPVLRAGAGLDSEGESVLGGQIGIVDFGTSSAVEIALAFFEARLVEDYGGRAPNRFGEDEPHQYHEDTEVRGVGPLASLLAGDGPRGSRGPYLALGLGVGAFQVDWHVVSPTDGALGAAQPGGGSLREESVLLPGGLGSVGLGYRVHRRLDLRAHALTLLTPSTNTREDLKLLSAFMLTAGLEL
jgi:hypothetical protein